ncbi:MAG: HAD family hydrolase [Lachnospiraceae bacterium]|nr:HAD family hydrolase [Lachnospiraceae bacterium]
MMEKNTESTVKNNKESKASASARYKAAIFDMDGTVLDTLEDLKDALNWALKECGHEITLTREQTAHCFGSAVHVAIQRALSIEAGMTEDDLLVIGTAGHETVDGISEDEVNRIQAVYKPYYEAHCGDKTGPYAGIPESIQKLRSAGIRCAVVSNKPDPAVQSLVASDFPGVFDFALGEKAGTRRKPAPDMTLQSLKALGVDPEDAVYIGDTEIDFRTAKNSGLDCISVTWGFRGRKFLENLGSKVIVDTPEEMADHILGK